jgi:hypothetical protein
MEEKSATPNKKPARPAKKHKQEVYTLRDMREYFGESLLIIFSVLLALVLTEYINNLHEKSQTRELMENIKNELVKNKQLEVAQYAYQLGVIKRIDSAINDPALQRKIIANGEFHYEYIFSGNHGVLYGDLSKVAWEVAKSQNIFPKIDIKLVEQLTSIYDDQERIGKLEDKIGGIFLSYESRNESNARQTLILMRDNYKGWAVDRAPGLILQYDAAIKAIGAEQ